MHTKDKYHLLNYCSTVWVLGCRIHEFPTLVLVKSVKAPELNSLKDDSYCKRIWLHMEYILDF